MALASTDKHHHDDSHSASEGYMKPGAGVTFTNDYDGKSNPGVMESFTLSAKLLQPVDNVQFSISSPDNILVGGEIQYSEVSPQSNTIEIPISVLSSEEGRYYLNVQVVTNASGYQSSRAHAVKVVFGNPPAMKSKTVHTTADGESIVIMEAQETISE
ncbi:hypothetical protein [Marinibactrum halimedae]|nr:hypothetical protein [Marinibactrum halimedae]